MAECYACLARLIGGQPVRRIPIYKAAKKQPDTEPTETVWCVPCADAEGLRNGPGVTFGSWARGFRAESRREK